jgi:ornithine cyclodeaminase/alanine dehydrogenase-like protein (mu-crystallin family)
MNLLTDEASLPFYDAARIAAALPFDTLISALRESFASGDAVPMRHHHTIEQAGAPPATLLLMPAWRDGHLGVKLVNVFPGNAVKGLPALHSVYLLFDGTDGRPVALLDGNEITGRRTVATAALAASYLARADASSLLLIGAGRVAALTASAMRAVRPIRRVLIWNRSRPKADALMEQLRREGFETEYAWRLRRWLRGHGFDQVSMST